MIHYLMYVNDEGDITQIRIAKGINPANRAVDPVVGQYCIHYMEALEDIGAFHSLNYWNYDTQQWQTRLDRPNKHAVWKAGAWTWDAQILLEDIRTERNYRLARCDWTAVNDNPLSETQKTEAVNYRTALRNLTDNITMEDIDSVDSTPWPSPPSFLLPA